MKKTFIALAIVISGAALVLGMDLGRFAFKYVDAGGHPVRMWITGHGSPTVVFESGGSGANGGALESWTKEQSAISKFTRTVSYDRPGIGFSAPGPLPRDARQIARDLHLALQNAGIQPPYILVGHSLGGPYNRVFAGMYPDEVQGLVLVDPTQEEFIDWTLARHPNNHADDDLKEIMATLSEAHESTVPNGIPVALIIGMGPNPLPDFMTQEEQQEYQENHQKWLEFHDEWLKKLPNSRHIVTEKSGHEVPFSEPELVINAVRQMVEHIAKNQ